MDTPLWRREFLRVSGLGLAAGLAGCQALQSSNEPDTETATPIQPGAEESTTELPPIEGRVTAISGEPISGASVATIEYDGRAITTTTTDADGRFSLDTVVAPVWTEISASGYINRTVAATPDTPLQVELTQRDGTVSMSFGGDVMFGRRFYETDDDSLNDHFRIRPSERLSDHREILRYIQPPLKNADITSINLETPLTTTDWRHPTKRYSFVSHPTAATALSDAGVDYAALGNNHVFDALTPGLTETRQTLDSAGISYSGAGGTPEQAWGPAYFERSGVTIGILSCTTVTGDQYSINWSADSGRSDEHSVSRTVDGDGTEETLEFSGDMGAAEADEERLRTYVSEVAANADITVVQIHGGAEYQRTPTTTIERLTESASTAGADLVVNHHPHVTGGVEIRDSTLVAWSLGNLVFDQELWQTYPSYLLTVHVTKDGVRRAYLDPLLLERYVPKGVVAKPNQFQLRNTAGLSPMEFALEQSKLQYLDDRHRDVRTEQVEFDGDGEIFVRESGWIQSVIDGADNVEPGTDLLLTGDFDDPDIDDEQYEGPLWRFGRRDDASGKGIGKDGTGGIQLIREEGNTQRAILSPISRIPVDGPITVTGQYQYGPSEGLELLWRWHSSTSGEALDERTFDLNGTGNGWGRFRKNFEVPSDANYVDFYLRLYPPDDGNRAVRFDELKLIEWDESESGRQYDHLRVNGSATVELAKLSGQETGISWTNLNG